MASPDAGDHLVAFVDLLGFEQTIRVSEEREKIILLLQTLSASRGNFSIESKKTEHGHHSNVRPAITAFSDNIVISYPTRELLEHQIGIHVALMSLESLISFIAWNALEVGLLIRGGISLGELYHADGVVVGCALIEAYELERKVAVYPRVVLSQTVAEHDEISRSNFGYSDFDGLRCSNYVRTAVLRTELGGGKVNLDVKPWVEYLRNLSRENIDRFRGSGDLRRLSKWRYFEQCLEKALSELPSDVLNMTREK